MRDCNPLHAHRESGFTLLEVLAGLVLASLILVSLNLAMSVVGKGVDKSAQNLGQQAAIATTIDIFSSDLARAAKIRRGSGKAFNGYLFSGTEQEMVFPLKERRGVSTPGLYLVRFSVRNENGTSQLTRERSPLAFGASGQDEPTWRDPVVLISGKYTIAFAYRAQRSGMRDWNSSWSGAENMPEQVRLTITDTASGRLRVPGFVQSLGVDAELECASAREALCGSASAGGEQ